MNEAALVSSFTVAPAPQWGLIKHVFTHRVSRPSLNTFTFTFSYKVLSPLLIMDPVRDADGLHDGQGVQAVRMSKNGDDV